MPEATLTADHPLVRAAAILHSEGSTGHRDIALHLTRSSDFERRGKRPGIRGTQPSLNVLVQSLAKAGHHESAAHLIEAKVCESYHVDHTAELVLELADVQ